MPIRLSRQYTPWATLGFLTTGDGVECRTLELPWRGNAQNKSCIPEGVYRWQRHESPTHGETLWLRGAPERTEILIHAANWPSQIDGCIAPGSEADFDCERGEPAVWDSGDALAALLEAVGDEGEIEIFTWRPEYP